MSWTQEKRSNGLMPQQEVTINICGVPEPCNPEESACSCASKRIRQASLCTSAQAGAIIALQNEGTRQRIEGQSEINRQRAEMTKEIEEVKEERDKRLPKWIAVTVAVATFIGGFLVGKTR